MIKTLSLFLVLGVVNLAPLAMMDAQAQNKPLSSVYDEDQKFLDFFKVKDDKERNSLREYEKIQMQRKSSLQKEKKELTPGDKKFVEKVDQELKLISMGYNPLRMIEEERVRAAKLLFKDDKVTEKVDAAKTQAAKLLKKKK